jgi:hypothetical protein
MPTATAEGATLIGRDLTMAERRGVSSGMGYLCQLICGLTLCLSFVPRYPKLKIHPLVLCPQLPLDGITSGIFPYLGGSVRADQLRSVMAAYESVIVSGRAGAKLAAKTPGVLIDPAMYVPQAKNEPETLFDDYDGWLVRQRAAGVSLILTDTPRIQNGDISALRKALARWNAIDEPTLVVLPLEPWWLREGLPRLIEEVRSAGRPVALVLLHRYNGLDIKGAVAGLLQFISAVKPVPVVLMRSDISAIGAVAHQAFAGFVGWSANSRHGPLPMRRPEGDDERDDSPSVLVPALNDYLKTSRLSVFARIRRLDVLRCDDRVCRGDSLLRIAGLYETDRQDGRMLACLHNLASTEQLARRILAAADPRGAWWGACHAGYRSIASLVESGVSLPQHHWTRQWLEMGSPAHDYQPVG